jgi:Prophage antirepressor|nr:MAG TPA: hypothetical protein [Caudoviricetes sp.]
MINDVTPNGNNPFEIFNYKNLGSVRTRVDEHGNPWFCLVDICNILGIKDQGTVAERLFDPGKVLNRIGVQTGFKADGTPAIQMMNILFIDEGNLYKVIMGSRKQEAQDFQKWICYEVIPMIRRTGAYLTPDVLANSYNDPNFFANFAKAYLEAQEQIKQLKPAADKFNNWLNRPDVVTVREGSLIMALKGIGLKTLFRYFRDHGYVTVKNVAYKRFIDQELFVVKKITTTTSNGNIYNILQTFLTHKGIDYFRDKLIAEGYQVIEFDGRLGQEGVISDPLTDAELLEYNVA